MTLSTHLSSEIIETSVRGSVLIALLFALRSLLTRCLPLKVLPWLWLVVAIKLLLISAPAGWWSLYNIEHFLHAPKAAPVQAGPDLSATTMGSLAPQSSTLLPVETPWNWSEILLLGWLAGVVVLAGLQIGVCIQFRRNLIREMRPNSNWNDLLNECAELSGLKNVPLLFETNLIDSPAVIGLMRPQLLVPHGILERLDREEIRLVFLHELSHLRRHDLWLLTLFATVRTMHWFNPLVWLAERVLRADCEAACDSEVLCRAPSISQRYGQTLLRLTQLSSGNTVSLLVAAISTNSNQTERRLRMIMRHRTISRGMGFAALVLVVLIGAVTLPNEVTAQETNTSTAVAPPSSGKAKLMAKLRSIVLPKVNFNKASVNEVLQFMVKKSVELDPDHEGVNFVLRLSKTGRPPEEAAPGIHNQVTVILDNLPIEDLLNYITQQTNLQYSVEDYAVYFRPAVDEPETLTVRTFLVPIGMFKVPSSMATSETVMVDVKDQLANLGFRFPVGATANLIPKSNKLVVRNTPEQLDLINKLTEQLNAPRPSQAVDPAKPQADDESVTRNRLVSTKIDQVDFNKTDIAQVLQFLTAKSKEADPSKVGITFVLAANLNPPYHGSREITLNLQKDNLLGILNEVLSQSNLGYTIKPNVIEVVPAADEAEALTELTFQTPLNFFNGRVGQPRPTGAEGVDVKPDLISRGLRFFNGTTATFYPDARKLVVLNTPTQLDLIQNLFDHMSRSAKPAAVTNPPGK